MDADNAEAIITATIDCSARLDRLVQPAYESQLRSENGARATLEADARGRPLRSSTPRCETDRGSP